MSHPNKPLSTSPLIDPAVCSLILIAAAQIVNVPLFLFLLVPSLESTASQNICPAPRPIGSSSPGSTPFSGNAPLLRRRSLEKIDPYWSSLAFG
jgi:hypothetical protein